MAQATRLLFKAITSLLKKRIKMTPNCYLAQVNVWFSNEYTSLLHKSIINDK